VKKRTSYEALDAIIRTVEEASTEVATEESIAKHQEQLREIFDSTTAWVLANYKSATVAIDKNGAVFVVSELKDGTKDGRTVKEGKTVLHLNEAAHTKEHKKEKLVDANCVFCQMEGTK
jgi:hypothetical protein